MNTSFDRGSNSSPDHQRRRRTVRDGTSTLGRGVSSTRFPSRQLATAAVGAGLDGLDVDGSDLAESDFAESDDAAAGLVPPSAGVSDFVAVAASSFFAVPVDVEPESLADRLSVMYQPEPLKTTPTGPITRRIVPWHVGQMVKASSLNF